MRKIGQGVRPILFAVGMLTAASTVFAAPPNTLQPAQTDDAAGKPHSPASANAPSWERPATGLSFTTRVAGRRLPDDLRNLLEDARELGLEDEDGVPGPATLSQLRRRAQEDAKRLDEVLRSEAYYNGRVEPTVRQAAGGSFEVVYLVVLGPRTMIRSFNIIYPDAPADTATLPADGAALGLKPERAARAQRIIDLTSDAVTHLHNHGYPNATLDNRRVVVDLAAQQADVTLRITAGPRYTFGPILVENDAGRTKAEYVRSLVTFKSGDIYNRSAVDETQAALRGTGLFNGVSIASGAPSDAALPQIVELKEAPPRTVRLGASWSSSEGAGVRGSWEHRNIFGEAEKLTLALAIAQIEQKATAEFRKPNFMRAEQSLLASFEIAHEDNDAYKEDRIKTGVSLERPLTERLTGSAGVTFEITETEDVNGRIDYQLFGIPVQLRYDSTDDLLDPTKGERVILGGTPFFGTSEGKPNSFIRFEATGSTYLTFADALTLAVRGRYGSIFANETADVPGSTRFYAGGGGSVRGYGYQLAGPLDVNGDPIGGRSVLEANLEARYRATENIGVVAFVDGGQAYENTTPSFDGELLWGAGVGLRYYTPIGPVRADIAIPLDKRSGVDNDFQIYVSLGQAF